MHDQIFPLRNHLVYHLNRLNFPTPSLIYPFKIRQIFMDPFTSDVYWGNRLVVKSVISIIPYSSGPHTNPFKDLCRNESTKMNPFIFNIHLNIPANPFPNIHSCPHFLRPQTMKKCVVSGFRHLQTKEQIPSTGTWCLHKLTAVGIQF